MSLIFGLSLFAAAIFLTSYTATNADFNPTTVVDLFVIGSSFVLLGCLYWRHRFQFDKKVVLLLRAVAILLGICVLRFLIAAIWPPNPDNALHACLNMPAFFPKIECMVSLEFSQNYGARQIVTHFVALMVVIAGYHLSLLNRPKILYVLLVPAMIWCLVTAGSLLNQSTPSLWGYDIISPYRVKEASISAVVSNPGWTWPVFALPLAMLSGFLFSASAKKFLWLPVLFVFYFVIFACGQRAGYLLLSLFILLQVAFVFFRMRYQSKHKQILLGLIYLGFIGLAVAFFASGLYLEISKWLSLRLRYEVLTVSDDRLGMWLRALGHLMEKPLFGTGYASWMHIDPDIKFPTAHNWWIQTLVEHGILYFLSLLGAVFYFVYLCFKSRNRNKVHKVQLFLFLIAVALISMVQELDHVNIIYFQAALFAGWLLGASTYHIQVVGNRQYQVNYHLVFLALGTLFLTASVVAFLQFSTGGHAFSYAGNGEFVRSFRTKGKVVAFSTRASKRYSVVPLTGFRPVGHLGIEYTDFSSWGYFSSHMTLENGSRYWGKRHPYAVLNADDEVTRGTQKWWSFKLRYPHWQTDMGIFAEQGVYNWENNRDFKRAERWCTTNCLFYLNTDACKSSGGELTVAVPRTDVSTQKPVSVFVTKQPLPDNKRDLLKDGVLANLLEHTPGDKNEKMVFKTPNEHLQVALPGVSGTKGYLINLKTKPGYVPGSDGKSADMRELGVKLLDFKCVE